MKKVEFKPKVTVVLQISAGQTLEAVMHDNKVYVEYPMPIMGAIVSEEEPAEKVKPSPKSDLKKVEDKTGRPSGEPSQVDNTVYDEATLGKMKPAQLLKICEDRGVEIPEAGKNTNKKLRLLILDAQNNAEVSDEEEEVAEEAPKKRSGKRGGKKEVEDKKKKPSKKESPQKSLEKAFEDFDEAEITEEELGEVLVKQGGFDEEDVEDIIEDFTENTDDTIEDYVTKLLSEEEEEVEEGSDEEGASDDAEGTLTDIADLKKGDKVNVYFDEEEEYYEGVVKSNARGKVRVTFDDEVETIDEENNSKVYVL